MINAVRLLKMHINFYKKKLTYMYVRLTVNMCLKGSDLFINCGL